MNILLSLTFVACLSVVFSELVCDANDEKLSQTTEVCPLTCDTLGKVRCLGLFQKPSCHCTNGKVRNTQTKKCVAPEECQKTISETPKLLCNGLNEHYSETTPACPASCQIKARCLAILMKPSCQCKPGYMIDTVTKKCVAPEDCPQK